MASKITDMSKIRKVIKFHCNGKSKLYISKYLSLSRNTVKKYISLFEALGLTFEVIHQKTDAELELLFSHNVVETTRSLGFVIKFLVSDSAEMLSVPTNESRKYKVML